MMASPSSVGIANGCINGDRDPTEQKLDTTKKSATDTSDKSFLETFNLTHDNLNGYELKFDDANWARNINALKPIVTSLKFP